MSLPYRSDVDGLRAVAIIPVVLYHYAVPGFSGGYVGVDIFFVISGFLITSLIQHEIHAETFSFTHFYERRIRRIFPALFFLLLVTSVLAFIQLFPRGLHDYGQSVVATAGFFSNVEFWWETGYFNPASHDKPLLHTWSLAVEEQFYLVLPPLLVLTARFLKARYAAVLVLIGAGSLALSIWGARFAPSFCFYLLPARIWELLLGALIAVSGAHLVRRSDTLNTAMALLGAGMVGTAVANFTAETPFPGVAALLPCAGAGLIIAAGGANAINQCLSWRPVVFVGLISYSLYLWHWPLYVFAKSRLMREPTGFETVALIALSAIIAVVSWRLIEQPFRGKQGILTRPALFTVAGGAMAASAAFGLTVFVFDGLPERFTPEARAALNAGRMYVCEEVEQTSAGPLCRIGSPVAKHPSFLIWGDSHARALTPAVARAAERFGLAGLSAIRQACPPLIGINRTDSNLSEYANQECRRHNDGVLAYLQSAPISTVIMVARWSLHIEGVPYGAERERAVFLSDDDSQTHSKAENRVAFERSFARTVQTLRASGRRVVVVGPVPEIGTLVPEALAHSLYYRGAADFGPTLAEFEARNTIVLANLRAFAADIDVIYPHFILCQTGRCAVALEGKPLYLDDDHLSLFGSQYIHILFEPLFARMMRAN